MTPHFILRQIFNYHVYSPPPHRNITCSYSLVTARTWSTNRCIMGLLFSFQSSTLSSSNLSKSKISGICVCGITKNWRYPESNQNGTQRNGIINWKRRLMRCFENQYPRRGSSQKQQRRYFALRGRGVGGLCLEDTWRYLIGQVAMCRFSGTVFMVLCFCGSRLHVICGARGFIWCLLYSHAILRESDPLMEDDSQCDERLRLDDTLWVTFTRLMEWPLT